MLIDFTVENFRSIREPQTLSLLATSARELPGNVFALEREPRIRLLKSAVIYGANASGKSNLLRAVGAMITYVRNATDLKLDQPIPYYDPFRLDPDYATKPTRFEAEFVVQGVRYRYAFAFTRTDVVEEELYYYPKKIATKLFVRRKGEPMSFGDHLKGARKAIEEQLLDNVLFLSKAANSRNEMLQEVYSSFIGRFIVDSSAYGLGRDYLEYRTTKMILNDSSATKSLFIKNYLRKVDKSLDSIEIEKREQSQIRVKLPEDMPPELINEILESLSYKVITRHIAASKDAEKVKFSLSDESDGTIKSYGISGMIVTTLLRGGVLIIDELNNSLHPIIVRFIIDLFNSKKSNPRNAQLIIATHDTTLLDPKLFRRDQIWFTEKDAVGQTRLFSLAEFDSKEVRKDTPFGRWYLAGRFGAVPIVNDLELEIPDPAHAQEAED